MAKNRARPRKSPTTPSLIESSLVTKKPRTSARKKIKRFSFVKRKFPISHLEELVISNNGQPNAPLNTTQFLISNFEANIADSQGTPYQIPPSVDSQENFSQEIDLNPFGSMSSWMSLERTHSFRTVDM